jgi:hypothetical protein
MYKQQSNLLRFYGKKPWASLAGVSDGKAADDPAPSNATTVQVFQEMPEKQHYVAQDGRGKKRPAEREVFAQPPPKVREGLGADMHKEKMREKLLGDDAKEESYKYVKFGSVVLDFLH